MRRRLPPLNPLKTFDAVARHKSIAGAASELLVTQSAISHQLKSLESSLGIKLLERRRGNIILTRPGTDLYTEISAAFEILAGAISKIENPPSEGDIQVSCAPAFLSYWLIPRLKKLNLDVPGMRVHLGASERTDDVYSSTADVSIRYGDGKWPGCWVHLLSPLQLFPVVSPSAALSLPLKIPKDLKQHTILHADQGEEWQTWFTAAGAGKQVHNQQLFLSGAQTSLDMAINGLGAALGDQITTDKFIDSGLLIEPFDVRTPAFGALYIVCKDGSEKKPLVESFIDWLFVQFKH